MLAAVGPWIGDHLYIPRHTLYIIPCTHRYYPTYIYVFLKNCFLINLTLRNVNEQNGPFDKIIETAKKRIVISKNEPFRM